MQSRAERCLGVVFATLAAGCSCPPPPAHVTDVALETSVPAPTDREIDDAATTDDRAAIDAVLDGWHAAAARADEDAYFDAMTDDAVFLGTDATERWGKRAFRAYAHPHFAKGKAWRFRATRRDVTVATGAVLAWFDEDLATPNLGPARGSGVLRKEGGQWRIAHYNLAITVPNERFGEVKKLLEVTPSGTSAPGSPPPDPADSSD